MTKKLFIPGPVDVSLDVLDKMASPMIGHRTKEASLLQQDISQKLQQIMFTQNTIILSSSSGSGLMEGAVRSFTNQKVAVFSIGAFGDRWYKMCEANGIKADLFVSELGEITTPLMIETALATEEYDVVTVTHNETATGIANPLEAIAKVMKKFPDVIFCVDAVSSLGGDYIAVDEWGIDVCITSTQKCLGLPPGLSIASVSSKAIEKAKTVPNRGLYFDYVELYQFVQTKNYQYPSTPALSIMFALNYQLDKIMQEGIMARFDRHKAMAQKVRQWAEKRLALYSNPDYLSNTVTCIKNTSNKSFKEIDYALQQQGYVISNGYGALKDTTFRIAHMADTRLEEIDELLVIMDKVFNF